MSHVIGVTDILSRSNGDLILLKGTLCVLCH